MGYTKPNYDKAEETVWLHVLGSQFRYPQDFVSVNTVDKLVEGIDSKEIDMEYRRWEEDNNGKVTKHIVFSVPPEQAKYKSSKKTVQCCAYNATDDFLRKTKGVILDSSDKSWYESLDVVVSSGLPEQNTITVLNELVKPYGLGVSRVIVRKGQSSFEEWGPWKKTLGINALAGVTGMVSNDEYLDQLSGGNEEVRTALKADLGDPRFEYRDNIDGFGPMVVFTTVTSITNYAAGGGHASYRGPRDIPSSWKMALQFDYIDKIPYQDEVPANEYGKSAPQMMPDWYQCTVTPGGKTFSMYANGSYYTTGAGSKTGQASSSSSQTTAQSGKTSSTNGQGENPNFLDFCLMFIGGSTVMETDYLVNEELVTRVKEFIREQADKHQLIHAVNMNNISNAYQMEKISWLKPRLLDLKFASIAFHTKEFSGWITAMECYRIITEMPTRAEKVVAEFICDAIMFGPVVAS